MSEYFLQQAIEWSSVWYTAHLGEEVEGEEFDRRAEAVELLIKCRETITTDKVSLDKFVEESRDKAELWLDSHYSFCQLCDVADMVRRTLQFSSFEATTIPSEQTALYISEASRTYIRGFLLSSVAMARCALEQALKERLAQFIHRGEPDRTLNGLIELAAQKDSVLSRTSIKPARDLARKCNSVMHKRPVLGEREVFEILLGIRGLLIEIYSPDRR